MLIAAGTYCTVTARGGLPDAPSDISSMGQSADAEGLELDPRLAETFAPIR